MAKKAYVHINSESFNHQIVLVADNSDPRLAPSNHSLLKTHDIVKKTGIPGAYYEVIGRESNGVFILKELSQNLIWPVPEEEIESYEKISL